MNAKKVGRQSRHDASSRTSEVSSHLFGTEPRAPYIYGWREIMPARYGHFYTTMSFYQMEDVQSSNIRCDD